MRRFPKPGNRHVRRIIRRSAAAPHRLGSEREPRTRPQLRYASDTLDESSNRSEDLEYVATIPLLEQDSERFGAILILWDRADRQI